MACLLLTGSQASQLIGAILELHDQIAVAVPRSAQERERTRSAPRIVDLCVFFLDAAMQEFADMNYFLQFVEAGDAQMILRIFEILDPSRARPG